MKNNQFSAHDIKKKCEQKLSLDFAGKKEFNARTRYQGKLIRVTIPKGRDCLPPKIYKSIAQQLYLNVKQFDELLSCNFYESDFYRNLDSIIGSKFHP